MREHVARDRRALRLGARRKRRLEVLQRQPPVRAVDGVERAAEDACRRPARPPIGSGRRIARAVITAPDTRAGAATSGDGRGFAHRAPSRADLHQPLVERAGGSISTRQRHAGDRHARNGRNGSSRTRSFSVVTPARAPAARAALGDRRDVARPCSDDDRETAARGRPTSPPPADPRRTRRAARSRRPPRPVPRTARPASPTASASRARPAAGARARSAGRRSASDACRPSSSSDEDVGRRRRVDRLAQPARRQRAAAARDRRGR